MGQWTPLPACSARPGFTSVGSVWANGVRAVGWIIEKSEITRQPLLLDLGMYPCQKDGSLLRFRRPVRTARKYFLPWATFAGVRWGLG